MMDGYFCKRPGSGRRLFKHQRMLRLFKGIGELSATLYL